MHAELTIWHETTLCTWCEKDRECVTTSIDGFLMTTPLCWSCLAKAIKVRTQQERSSTVPTVPDEEPRPSGTLK